jgi:hypothetical protein
MRAWSSAAQHVICVAVIERETMNGQEFVLRCTKKSAAAQFD